jgi:hypothetical protein
MPKGADIDLSDTAPAGNLRLAAESYLGRTLPATTEIAYSLREVLLVAQEERGALSEISGVLALFDVGKIHEGEVRERIQRIVDRTGQ